MTLDEFTKALTNVSNEALLADLAHYIEAWKSDDRDVNELDAMVERFFGNSWLPIEQDHSKAYGYWKSFRDEAIHSIRGMTMNERLYTFALVERFDSSKSEEERRAVYSKLLAKP